MIAWKVTVTIDVADATNRSQKHLGVEMAERMLIAMEEFGKSNNLSVGGVCVLTEKGDEVNRKESKE